MEIAFRIFVAFMLVSAAPVSYAKLLTWYMQDVRVENGDTIHGFFQFDPSTVVRPPTWDVASDSVVSDSIGAHPSSAAVFYMGQTWIVVENGQSSQMGFRFIFNGALPVVGGTVPIADGKEFICIHSGDCAFQPSTVSGSVTTIPEPSGFLFVGLALIPLLVVAARGGLSGFTKRGATDFQGLPSYRKNP